ncbi:hypothetical protein [Streptomyces sp. NPDC001492]
MGEIEPAAGLVGLAHADHATVNVEVLALQEVEQPEVLGPQQTARGRDPGRPEVSLSRQAVTETEHGRPRARRIRSFPGDTANDRSGIELGSAGGVDMATR